MDTLTLGDQIVTLINRLRESLPPPRWPYGRSEPRWRLDEYGYPDKYDCAIEAADQTIEEETT